MKQTDNFYLRGITMTNLNYKTATTILLIGMLPFAAVRAEPETSALAKELTARSGSAITLRLSSGQELTGKLTMLNEDAVMLEELTGREFFDAVIPVDRIEALIARRPAK